MVRPGLTRPLERRGLRAWSGAVARLARSSFSGGLLLCGGCALAPRSQVDECHQLSRTLRSENARLKDQLLVLQAQNRDYADRAVDDSRRLASQDEAIERLETQRAGVPGRTSSPGIGLPPACIEPGRNSSPGRRTIEPGVPCPAPPTRSVALKRPAVGAAEDRGDGDREGPRK